MLLLVPRRRAVQLAQVVVRHPVRRHHLKRRLVRGGALGHVPRRRLRPRHALRRRLVRDPHILQRKEVRAVQPACIFASCFSLLEVVCGLHSDGDTLADVGRRVHPTRREVQRLSLENTEDAAVTFLSETETRQVAQLAQTPCADASQKPQRAALRTCSWRHSIGLSSGESPDSTSSSQCCRPTSGSGSALRGIVPATNVRFTVSLRLSLLVSI